MKIHTQGFSLRDRILAHVELVPESGCWYWLGKLDRDGYGKVWNGAKEVRAHRLSYHIWRGVLAEGAHLHHQCHEKSCVNPSHLSVMRPGPHSSLHAKRRDRCNCGAEYHLRGAVKWCPDCRRKYNRGYHLSNRIVLNAKKRARRQATKGF